jgi:hypothetical protein
MRLGFFNAAGLAGKIETVQELMHEHNCTTLFVSETKMHRYRTQTSYPFIASSSRLPESRKNIPTKHGVALLGDRSLYGGWQNHIVVNATDDMGHFLVWSHGDAQFVGLYLPPFTDRETYTEATIIVDTAMSEASKTPKRFRFLVGDLNIHGHGRSFISIASQPTGPHTRPWIPQDPNVGRLIHVLWPWFKPILIDP